MSTTWRFVSVIVHLHSTGFTKLHFPVRPASYGSHFGNPAYAWDHNTV